MDVVFFGTPTFALPALEKVHAAHRLKAVVSQPDKPRGRGRRPSPSPTKTWAKAHDIPVLEPAFLKGNDEFREALTGLGADVCVVAAYGRILTAEILAVPKLGFINIHGSILPRYRGSAPIQRAIMDGLAKTGVTIMCVEEAMDTGDILQIVEVPIESEDDYGSLSAKMAVAGAEALVESLSKIAAGTAVRIPQDDSLATMAPSITKEETVVDWARPAPALVNLVRALSPRPGARTFWAGTTLKIFKARVANSEREAAGPGRLSVEGERLFAGTGAGTLELLMVQPQGKRAMTAAEFARGYRPVNGAELSASPGPPPE